MEAIYQDYAPRGVKFYYIYKALAHPENSGYVSPFTLEERLLHIEEAKRKLRSKITWLCDTMDNDLKHQLGDAPNSEFVIDPSGKVVRRRAWSEPERLRADLVELIGPVSRPTLPKDVDLGVIGPAQLAKTGVVPRVTVTRRMLPLQIEATENGQPLYVKLRAEASVDFLDSGTGQLYLGFHLDPLYKVHWNNLTEPLQYRLKVPPGLSASALSGQGPKVEQEADSDPREFLLDISLDKEQIADAPPIELEVDYFACNDEAGLCQAVTQRYRIYLSQDPDGGWNAERFRIGGRTGAANATRGPGRNRGSVGRPSPMLIQRIEAVLNELESADADGDGKISRDEASANVRPVFDRMDTNQDGFIDDSEREATRERLQQMRRATSLRDGGNP